MPIDTLSSSLGSPDDEVLVAAVIGGDAGAARVLHRRLEPLLRAVARRVMGTRRAGVEPADLMQHAWLGLADRRWRRLAGFEGGKGALEAYVSRIAERLMRSLLRRCGGPGPMVVVGDLPEVGGDVGGAERRVVAGILCRQLLDLVAREVSPLALACVRGRHLDGLDTGELAAALGLSANAVYIHEHRVRAYARRIGSGERMPARGRRAKVGRGARGGAQVSRSAS